MAYLSVSNLIALEITKNGSRSLVYAANKVGKATYCGHHDITTQIQRAGCTNPEIIAVIRDPAQRLVSQINFHFTGRRLNMAQALEMCVANGIGFNSVMQRQVDFLRHKGEPHTLKLFPMERMSDAIKAIGYAGETPHENKRPHMWNRKQLEAHPLWEEILAYYEPDRKLRETLDF